MLRKVSLWIFLLAALAACSKRIGSDDIAIGQFDLRIINGEIHDGPDGDPYAADITIFDPARLQDHAIFAEPH